MKQMKTISRLVLIAVFLLSVSLVSAQPALAATTVMYIAPGGLTGGACDSWANACDLQYGLTSAAAGSELWVKAGTYRPTTTTDQTATFQLKNGVALYGGFAGTETLRAQRDPAANVTILSGDIGANDTANPITSISQINPGNSYHVVTGSGADATAVLDGFTVTAGTANSSGIYANGAGMYNSAGSPTLANIVFSGNYANDGGGMYNLNSSPTLTNVAFNAHMALDGGGMYNLNSNPTLNNVTFYSNNASSGYGGGMENNNSSPSLSNVTFSANSAMYGGGIYNVNGSHPALTDVTFLVNSAPKGGGMYNIVSNPTLTNVTFEANNSSGNLGGAIYDDGSNPALTNVTFYANTAAIGGAMYNSNSSGPTLNHVTFSGNWATFTAIGGNGVMANFSGSNPVMKNSIIWDSISSIDDQIYDDAGATTISYSVVQGGYAGTGNLSTDPLLGAFANHGGFTKTIALGVGSSAIDTADTTSCASTDQRGVTRPQGSGCDMGAFEVLQSTPTPTVMATLTSTITVTPTEADTPTLTETPAPTSTFTPTETDTPALTETPAPTSTATPTETDTPALTETPAPTSTVTATEPDTLTPTVTPTRTVSPTPTSTSTAVPGADFFGAPLSGSAPLTVQFTALDSSMLSHCKWDFGDGTSETFTPLPGQHFPVCPSTSHVYDSVGSFTVSLSVTKYTNGYSNSMTKTNYIQVNAPAPTATPAPTLTPTGTETLTLTPTETATPTLTLTGTRTTTATPSLTRTPTRASVTRTFSSVATQDGWVLELGENSNSGGSMNSVAVTFQLGDDAANRQYRAILSFDTSSLPDNAVISSVTLKIMPGGAPAGKPNLLGTMWVDIRKGPFGAAALQLGDFNAAASALKVGAFDKTPPATGWYSAVLNPAGRSNINKAGLTQFRLYFALDDNNNHIADFMKFLSGDSLSNKPVLVITYTIP